MSSTLSVRSGIVWCRRSVARPLVAVAAHPPRAGESTARAANTAWWAPGASVRVCGFRHRTAPRLFPSSGFLQGPSACVLLSLRETPVSLRPVLGLRPLVWGLEVFS